MVYGRASCVAHVLMCSSDDNNHSVINSHFSAFSSMYYSPPVRSCAHTYKQTKHFDSSSAPPIRLAHFRESAFYYGYYLEYIAVEYCVNIDFLRKYLALFLGYSFEMLFVQIILLLLGDFMRYIYHENALCRIRLSPQNCETHARQNC